MTDQNLDRVSGKIAPTVVEFLKDRLASGATDFYIEELQAYVSRRLTIAPASPDRILRDLRQRGKVNYRVLRRASAYYQVTSA